MLQLKRTNPSHSPPIQSTVRDMVASPSLGLGPPRQTQLLQVLGEL